jgi:hypothetical protein
MRGAPDPEMRSPAVCSGRAKSQIEDSLSTSDTATAPIDFQARKLRRLFFLTPDTAVTVATLAYGVAR